MENYIPLAISALMGVILLKLLTLPLKFTCKAAIHGTFGFLCLWILNSVSGYTGMYIPINAVTVLIAGIFGVPGMGLLAVLQLFA